MFEIVKNEMILTFKNKNYLKIVSIVLLILFSVFSTDAFNKKNSEVQNVQTQDTNGQEQSNITEETKLESIFHEKNFKDDENLEIGKNRVLIKGQDGQKEVTLRHIWVDGKIVNSEKLQEKVIIEPINEVILRGTKEIKKVQEKTKTNDKIKPENKSKVKQNGTNQPDAEKTDKTEAEPKKKSESTAKNEKTIIDKNGKKISYKSKIVGSGTAYTAEKGALTATGKPAKYGLVAVDPSKIPYGTKLYIKSADGKYDYGYAVAEDTGGFAKKGSAITDLYMNTKSECVNFGRRKTEIYILD